MSKILDKIVQMAFGCLHAFVFAGLPSVFLELSL